MTTKDALSVGRDSFGKQVWAAAYARLSAADRQSPLDAEDLERLATAAYLVGRDEESAELWARAHRLRLEHGDVPEAVRCAFWLAFGLLDRGEHARAGGWLARARRLLEGGPQECVEHGYLLLPLALESIHEGDPEAAAEIFGRATAIGERCGDPDLVALGRNGRGRALIRLGEIREGVALLDEAMVAVEAGEVSPVPAGDVYCSMIEGCHEIFDLRRAQQWTAALSRWCDSQPELAAYRGQCLVRRAEIMQLRGAWADALEEALQACERLMRPPARPAAGAAFYQRAELHRLRGDFDRAEEAYKEASRRGRKAQPGLALLRLARGQIAAADETQDPAPRSRMLPAYVEITIAAGNVPVARAAAAELSEIAARFDASLLGAAAGAARGAVLLAEGDPRAALHVLRKALTAWESLEAPYEAARVRVLSALACRELGDEDGAELELEAARWTFARLGAAPELARIDSLVQRSHARDDHETYGLTRRELQVLRRVAAGETNRAIAAELFISERTVERHVSNIFTKLGVSSRAAATAWAYESQLV
jgi:DNA-binding NarL/FixJ family response regulator